jgi:spermidine synthase
VIDREDGIKILALDHLIHSFVKPDDPAYLDYTYLKMFSELVKYTAQQNKTPSTLHLGGGGYSFPRYMEAIYPGSVNDVIEIDPAVTEIAYEELGLSSETSIRTYNEDARLFLKRGGSGLKYDFVIGDVFNDKSTPYQLTTLEFDRMVKATMNDGGIYLVNIIDRFEEGKYMPAFINTLEQVFGHVYLFSPGVSFESIDTGTFVLAATDRPIDLAALVTYLESQGNQVYSLPLEEDRLVAYLAERKPILLTDDYVPTDILVAELIK